MTRIHLIHTCANCGQDKGVRREHQEFCDYCWSERNGAFAKKRRKLHPFSMKNLVVA